MLNKIGFPQHVTCPVCKTQKKTVLRQPIERSKGVQFTSEEANTETQLNAIANDLASVELAIKKKRRKSDKNAGLILPSSMIKHHVPSTATVKHLQPPSPASLPATPKLNQTPNNAKPNSGPLHVQQQRKHGKSKKPQPKQLSANAQRFAAEKQRNNILMLANALKAGSTNVATPMRGLQSLLRK